MKNITKSDTAKLAIVAFVSGVFILVFAGAEFFTQQCDINPGNSFSEKICSASTVLTAQIIQGVALLGTALCAFFAGGKMADAIVDETPKTGPLVSLCLMAALLALCFSGAITIFLEKILFYLL